MRYVHLYLTCIKRSMISRLEYKKDTLVALSSFFFSNLCSLAALYFILQSIPALAGYSLPEVGFFYGFSMLPIALDHLFSDELWLVAYRRVKDGDMDMHFLRPVPVLFQVFAETFQPEGFGELILGAALIAVCASNLTVTVTFGSVAVLFVGALFGAAIITSLKIALRQIPAGHLSGLHPRAFDLRAALRAVHFSAGRHAALRKAQPVAALRRDHRLRRRLLRPRRVGLDCL